MKHILITILFFGTYLSTFGQSNKHDDLAQQINRQLVIDLDKLKDSAAFYSFSFRLELKNKNHMAVLDNFSVNDSIAYAVVENINFIKKLDYRKITFNGTRKTVIVPVGIIVMNYEGNAKPDGKILAVDLATKINQLFHYQANLKTKIDQFMYLPPIIIYGDKKVYD